MSLWTDLVAGRADALHRRVEERLRRDAEGVLRAPEPELELRILRRLRAEGAQGRARAERHLRVALLAIAGAAAAALVLALARISAERDPVAPGQVDAPEIAARVEVPPPAPAQGLGELIGLGGARLALGVDAPLQREARLLARDGELVARALLAGLPHPLRRAVDGSAMR